MNHLETDEETVVALRNADAPSQLVFVCEHASARIPARYGDLGLAPEARSSHAAWDPGALALAEHLADRFGAVLVAASVSRLVIDCNRPPEAPDAMPARSEIFDIPGNAKLDKAEREIRSQSYYTPFHAAVAKAISDRSDPILVTVHSFTPVYHGAARTVEIGVLHDRDARLADAMLDAADRAGAQNVRRNDPYGPEDGVTHTLKKHALPGKHLNVMLEVRNDLIADAAAQDDMAKRLGDWLESALSTTGAAAC